MDAARRNVTWAHAAMQRNAFADPQQALAAVDARGWLLCALAANARAVLGRTHLDAVRDQRRGRRTPEARQSRVLAALAWIDRLDAARVVTPEPGLDGGSLVAAAWRAARTAVDAASDLALTHFDDAGGLRLHAPDVLAGSTWGQLTADSMRITATVAAVEPLAQRCRQAGLTRAQVDHYLPLDDDLVDQTWALAAAWGFPPGRARDITVSRPELRTGDPAAEWTDRMTRVRLQMLGHRDRGRVGVRTLRDVARLGTVTSHVLATSGHADAPAQSAVTGQWQSLTEYLAPLRSTEPADHVVHGHVERMLDLASPSHTASRSTARDRLLRAIDCSTPTLDDCSAIAEQLMTSSSDLWLPAKPQRRYLRVIPAATTRATHPATAPHPWPRPTRTAPGRRSVGLS
jgi:hypothetical protein